MKDSTIVLHAGYEKGDFGTMSVPIYQTTAYAFRDSEHAANLFALKELGNIYTRLMNPTSDVLEKRFCALEQGAASIATASGAAAVFYAFANVAGCGDNIILAKQAYGGTLTLAAHTLKRFGIEAKFFDVTKPNELEGLIDDKTKMIFFEVIPNPSVTLCDIDEIVKIANKHGVLTCADNTVSTPIICKPLTLGVDITVSSTSKYASGNGSALGGMLTERKGLVDKLKGNSRYAYFNEADESYHGLVYTDLPLPPFILRCRLAMQRDFGATPSPHNSWLLIQGLETLALRMEKHSKNALEVAKFLEAHPKVKGVNYPTISQKELVQRYFKDGMASGLLSFVLDSKEVAQKVAESTKIFSLVVNIGDSKSIITHPASTTHQQLSEQELIDAGVPAGLIRLSIGLEDVNDLIADLSEALDSCN